MLPIMVQGCDSRLGRCTVKIPQPRKSPVAWEHALAGLRSSPKRLPDICLAHRDRWTIFFEIKGLSAWANEYIIAPIERTGT